VKIAAIQMNSGIDKKKNLQVAERLVRRAAKNGAEFIALPEVFNYRSVDKKVRDVAETLKGETLTLIKKLAKELKAWILAGSILERAGGGKSYNTSALINPSGKMVAIYRKIHLFDSNVKGSAMKESTRIKAGKKPAIAKVGRYSLGMSICYDLRFPELYRKYATKKVEIFCVPSSFNRESMTFVSCALQKGQCINKYPGTTCGAPTAIVDILEIVDTNPTLPPSPDPSCNTWE